MWVMMKGCGFLSTNFGDRTSSCSRVMDKNPKVLLPLFPFLYITYLKFHKNSQSTSMQHLR